MKLPVLINPGGGSAADDAVDRVRAALDRAGIDSAIELVAGPALAARATELATGATPTIVAAGGDGTMSAVGGALAGTDTALGILPLGTLNHLARDLGISFNLDEAAATLAAGHRHKIDSAEVNGRRFVNNSSVGLYPLLVDSREAGQRRWGWTKKKAMLLASLRTLARFHHHRLRLSAGGRSLDIETPLLFVGNNDYAVTLPNVGQRASLTDGKLSVMVMHKTGRAGLVAIIARALFNRGRPGDMIRADMADELTVESRRSHLSVAVDGETVRLTPPLHYRIHPKSLWVIAPVHTGQASASVAHPPHRP